MNSIRLLFPLIFAVEIVFAVSLTAAIGYASQMQEARETATHFLDLIAGTLDDQLEKHLSVPAALVRSYAREARARPGLRFDRLLEPALVRGMIDSFQTQLLVSRGMNVAFANPAGQNFMLDRRGQSQPVVKISDAAKGGAVSWYGFDGFGLGGEPLEIQNTDYDPRRQPYYIAAVAMRDTAVSSIYANPLVKGAPVATVAEPVYDPRGTLRVVVSSDIDLQGIGIYMQGLRLPDDAVAFLFDGDGHFIAGSRRQAAGEAREERGRASILDHPEPAVRAMAAQMKKQLGSFSLPEPKQIQFFDAGVRHYAYAAPLSEKFGLNWKLAVVIPETDLIDNLIQSIDSLAWASLALLLVAIAAGLLTASWMIHPILTMGAVASALEKNQLTEPPLPASQLQRDTLRRNEFGQLAQVFLRMIEEIKARQNLLEAQLEQLRVDIDHEHTQTQVRQIAASDFFQDLKAKARRLRAERGQAAAPASKE